MIKIIYRSAIEGEQPSLSTEKSFNSIGSATQFIRRNKIQKASIFINDRLVVRIGNMYVPVSQLNIICSEALLNADKNQH